MSMELLQMKCPNCGADLDVEDGIESFFCKYCGTKIVLAGQSDAALKAKATVKVADKVVELREKRYEQKRYEMEKEEERQKRNSKSFPIVAIVFLLIAAIAFGSAFVSHNKQVQKLEALVVEIQNDIASGNYDAALIKANGLHYTADWSSGSEEQWDETRENLIELIKEAQARDNG